MLVLGIETSCDETAAAIVEDGRHVISENVYSSVAEHRPYRGVVPEIASRKHIEVISWLCEKTFADAGLPVSDIDLVAATRSPGLIGSLLVGYTFARSLADRYKIPFVAVDHLDGHIHSVFLENNNEVFPAVFLIVSGGHTQLVYAAGHQEYEVMGKTLDDACGESFDKVARMLGLGYPGGPEIDKLAEKGDENKIDFPRIFLKHGSLDFSYSGAKTAVLYYIKKLSDEETQKQVPDICASFQKSIADVLVKKSVTAVRKSKVNRFYMVGGVAANGYLRNRLKDAFDDINTPLYFPPFKYCGDNASMIASAGYYSAREKHLLTS